MISRQEHVFPDFFMGDYVRRRVVARVAELAQSDRPVLIIGETGVGKEGIAHSLFDTSHHGKEVFLQVDLLRTGSRAAEGIALGNVPESEKSRTEQQVAGQIVFLGLKKRLRTAEQRSFPAILTSRKGALYSFEGWKS